MLTQGHQQKYYTDMYTATKPHAGIPSNNCGLGGGGGGWVGWGGPDPTGCVVGPNIKAVLWLQTPAAVKPPQRGFKSQICA